MRKNLILLITILTLMAMVQSCVSPSGNGDDTESWRKGTNGIRITEILPSGNVDIGDQLKIKVDVENVGVLDKKVNVCAHGYDESIIFFKDPYCLSTNVLPAKNEYVPEGYPPETLEFITSYTVRNSKTFPQDIQFTACYPDKTEATAFLYIDRDKGTAKVTGLGSSQGAPVKIAGVNVNIEEDDEIKIVVRFENSGGGTPYLGHSLTGCHLIPEHELGYINYKVEGFNCEGSIRFPSVTAVECVQQNSQKIVNTPFKIESTYNYKQSNGKKTVWFEGNG